jgi:hypothetical protein
MKVIFLDIDGVLNSTRSCIALNGYGSPRRPWKLDPVAVNLLRYYVEKTGAYIVVSSTWRLGGAARAAGWFVNYGWFDAPVLDTTAKDFGRRRGEQIQEWLDAHDVEKYVILDDEDDMLTGQHLVRTDFDLGLTYADMKKVEGYLT